MTRGLVVVGGSYAAAHAIASARQAGYAEPIRLISAEDWLPYQRPPLSKSFPLDATTPESLLIKSAKFYHDAGVDVLLSTAVNEIDGAGKRALVDGTWLPYDELLLATGARPRALDVPGSALNGVLTLRTAADALQLRARLGQAEDIVVIGAGFVGLEIATCLAATGRSVTVLEAADRVMARAVSSDISRQLQRLHAMRGVRIRLRVGVAAISGSAGRAHSVRCKDGTHHAADLVVIGVGADADGTLAGTAGARADRGVAVDSAMRTSVSGVFAAGDCTQHPNRFAGGPIRLESVQNAVDQGRTAGAVIAGRDASYDSVPWFWSHQAGVHLQIAGLRRPGCRRLVRGNPEDKHTVLHLDEAGRLLAAESLDRPADHVQARAIVTSGTPLDPYFAADPNVALRDAAVHGALTRQRPTSH